MTLEMFFFRQNLATSKSAVSVSVAGTGFQSQTQVWFRVLSRFRKIVKAVLRRSQVAAAKA